jgi:hypothetical protein
MLLFVQNNAASLPGRLKIKGWLVVCLFVCLFACLLAKGYLFEPFSIYCSFFLI